MKFIHDDHQDESVNHIMDILHLMSKAERDDLSTFVAVDLRRIPNHEHPPCQSNTSARIISSLQARMDQLVQSATAEMRKIQDEIDNLRPTDSQVISPSRQMNRQKHPTSPPARNEQQPRNQSRETISDDENDNRTSHSTVPRPENQNTQPAKSNSIQPKKQLYSDKARKPPTRVTGTGTNTTGLKVSPLEIYVGRLAPDTQPVDIIDYVSQHVGIRVPCHQLETRRSGYASFRISIDRCHLDRILQSELWPRGAVIDLYKAPRQGNHSANNNNRRDKSRPDRPRDQMTMPIGTTSSRTVSMHTQIRISAVIHIRAAQTNPVNTPIPRARNTGMLITNNIHGYVSNEINILACHTNHDGFLSTEQWSAKPGFRPRQTYP